MKNRFIKKISELGLKPTDSEEQKITKGTLSLFSLLFGLAGLFVWGPLYFSNGLTLSGWIPFGYGIVVLLSLGVFAITKNFAFFRNSQLLLILILPFLLQLSLGGFINSGAVIIWSLVAPFGALAYFTPKKAFPWFIAYVALIVTSFVLNFYIKKYIDWEINESLINVFFLINLIGLSSYIYGLQYYYTNKQEQLKKNIDQQNQELEVQAEKLKENDKLKSQFFANISHEFRTPLTLISGLLNKQIENQHTPPLLQDSHTMKRNANRLLQLINQLLDISKLEAGELKLEVAQGDIASSIKNTVLLYESLGFEKNQKVLFNGTPIQEQKKHKKIEAFFDPEKFQKIVSNLVSNAIKFTPTEGLIEVSVKKNKGELKFTISNTGEGIPKESLPYVFNRFYQVDGESTREQEGTGIGLALVKELVELHHGQITADSNSEKTTFTINMPLERSYFSDDTILEQPQMISSPELPIADLHAIIQNPETEKQVSNTNGKKVLEILVVEDNADIRNYIKDILKPNYKVTLAVDGEDGLEKANTIIPDLIISDVMMPKVNGYELCHQLKTNESTNHIPIIMLTAKASKENKLDGLEIGADDYLTKPFDDKELKTRIKNLISIREKLQKKFQQESYLKPTEVKVNSVQQKFLQKIKEVVEANMDNEQFSVEDLGDKIGMSRSQIHRKLKALTDQSATQFIRNYRLHRAADLLKQDSGNVTEIAYQVGFSSQTYFSKSFQDLFGVSPTEFKKTE